MPEPFLRNFMRMATMGCRGDELVRGLGEEGTETGEAEGGLRQAREANVTAAVAAEELAWGDAAMLLCLPGPGLGGPPIRATGTPEQKERFFGMFKDMDTGPLKWGAYGLTEPGAGSDVAGIRTSCRKDGKHWVLERAQVLHHQRRARDRGT